MAQIPTAEELMNSEQYEPDSGISFEDYHGDNAAMVPSMMIEFAKLHVKAALEASANEYYPKDKENFELVAERFINAYPLENIK